MTSTKNQPIATHDYMLYKHDLQSNQYAIDLQAVNTMAPVEINVLDASIEIKEVLMDRQIALSKEAWQFLCVCKSQLDQALWEGTEIQIDLDDKVKASTCKFNGKTYLHIRRWSQGYPTKDGISFLKDNWKKFAEENMVCHNWAQCQRDMGNMTLFFSFTFE